MVMIQASHKTNNSYNDTHTHTERHGISYEDQLRGRRSWASEQHGLNQLIEVRKEQGRNETQGRYIAPKRPQPLQDYLSRGYLPGGGG